MKMKSYLRTFAPWIAYAVVSSVASWGVAMLAGAVVAVLTATWLIRRGGADLLSLGTIGYFVVMAGVAFADPHSPLQHFTVVLSLATLGALATGSLAARHPFTMTIARQMTPPAEWRRPLFYQVNAVITAVWAASFLTTAAACALVLTLLPPATLWIVLFGITGFLVPAIFTRIYPARVRARARAAAPTTTKESPLDSGFGAADRSQVADDGE